MAEHPPYVCKLDDFTQKKALEELNEDPKNRQGAIDTFREWILQQKHFKCPTDNEFLLAFLRTRYFSQLEARTLLQNFLKKRTKLSSWYDDVDIGSPEIIDLFKTKSVLILPKRDKEGRRVVMFRPALMYESKAFKKETMYRLISVLTDYIYLMDEMTHVHGTLSVMDFSKSTLAHETKLPFEDRRKMMQIWQSNYPARIKGFHVYNAGAVMDLVMMFIKMAMNEKIQKRLVVHGKSLESLYKHIPQELLPEEYQEDSFEGSSAGSEQSIVDSMIAEFTKPEIRARTRHLTSPKFKIDMKEKDTDVAEASFRKLNVE